MPTPKAGYTLADGTKVPGVTTVIGGNLGWNKSQLMWWANQEGLAGRNHRETAQAAADAGTLAHAMVEAYIHGVEYVAPAGIPEKQLALARTAFAAYCEWESDTKLLIVATEIKLVSERHRFGATPDAIGLRATKGLVLPDWKSSKGTYADHLLQLAAYGHAWEEVTSEPLVGGYYLCRFDKASGGFSVKWWPREALDGAWTAFLALRELHDLKAGVEALAK